MLHRLFVSTEAGTLPSAFCRVFTHAMRERAYVSLLLLCVVGRPAAYYSELQARETGPCMLPDAAQAMLSKDDAFQLRLSKESVQANEAVAGVGALESDSSRSARHKQSPLTLAAPETSSTPCLERDCVGRHGSRAAGSFDDASDVSAAFPVGVYDVNGQQIDLRAVSPLPLGLPRSCILM
jgi:hypothetical protein